jgi:hypothetical protein
MSFAEICECVYYWGAFRMTWLEEGEHDACEHTRRKWLERHLVERAKLPSRGF